MVLRALTILVNAQQRPNLQYRNIEKFKVFFLRDRHAANHSMEEFSTLLTRKYSTKNY